MCVIYYCKYVLVVLAQHFQRTGHSPPHFIILQEVIDVQTTITSIHDTSRHDTIVNVMFTQLFYLLTITKLRHPDTASSLMC
jgi:hypothetical protein